MNTLDVETAEVDERKIDSVVSAAQEILRAYPDGLRFVDLLDAIRNRGINFVSLPNYVQWLPRRNPELFSKPSRGLFVLTDNLARAGEAPDAIGTAKLDLRAPTIDDAREQVFYKSFADYLAGDLDECTKAVPVGGNAFGGKWGTPDVVGITLSRPRDIYKAPMEVISAEIKVATGKELITAFGQACSYQLFSHKTYVVVPNASRDSELDRLEALCQSFGIGLIIFDASAPETPNYQIRVRAIRKEPDRFYINEALTNKVFDDLLGFENS